LGRDFTSPGINGAYSTMWNYQPLATRGYAVFKPISPYGENTIVRDIADAVLSGVDKVVQLGIADPERLTVEGQSFGGFCVRALITQKARFKAAISTEGTSGNAITPYGSGHKQHRITADLFKNTDVFIANSPIFFYDRVKTPLLLQLGMNNGGSAAGGDTLWEYRILKDLGVEVQLLEYYGEDHVMAGYSNLIDFWNRRIAWLEKHR
jgi:dipeptidyl aminopeptidase/acylaminoacyl peptidase